MDKRLRGQGTGSLCGGGLIEEGFREEVASVQSLESKDSNSQMPSDTGLGVRDGVSVNFYFCKMPESKCFRLRWPYCLHCNCSRSPRSMEAV